VLIASLLVGGSTVILAQSNVSTGSLQGNTVNGDGGALPGVTIQASNVDTGFTRQAVSDDSGHYRVDQLPSGTYDVRAGLPGFRVEVKKGVPVTLGSRVTIDFIMSAASVEDEIVVMAASPVVEASSPGTTASVSDVAIANLPLNGRDFTDFVLLTPGAVMGRTSNIFTEVYGGRGGVNIGARSIQNSINIDGTNAGSSFFGNQRGGAESPFTYSQAAIKEFQVITSSYNLQFNSGGGVLNAITKSGTNELHGEVFGYYRDDNMVGANALGEEADDFEQIQYGLALGGPIVRDRLHFFASFDAQDLDIPTFREFNNFPDGRESDWEALTDLEWERELGLVMQTGDATVVLLKLDWQISNANLIAIRGNTMDMAGENLLNSFRTSGWSATGPMDNAYDSLVASLHSSLSAHTFNELIVQYSLEERPRSPNVTHPPPTQIRISSPYDGLFGTNRYVPNWLDEQRLQIVDNLSFFVGRHTVKLGVNIDLVEFDDSFIRDGGGHYTFWDWGSFLDGPTPSRYRQSFSDIDGRVVYGSDSYWLYAQDEWRINPRFTLTYGIGYDFQHRDQPPELNPLYPPTGQIPNDGDNWAPRVGFAWDIDGTGSQVLRGGVGYYYDRTPSILDANAMLVNGVTVVSVSFWCWRGEPCPTYPDRWESLGDLPTLGGPTVMAYDPQFENAETLRLSLGYEREVATDFAVGIDLLYSEGTHLERKQGQNLVRTGESTVDGRPMYETGTVYPELGKVIQFKSDARSRYRALVLKANKRFSSNWFLNASYTWARAEDDDSNERSVGSSFEYPEDHYDLGPEWGISNYDVEHKFVASGTVLLPLDFMVSAILSIRSGFPYTAWHWDDLNQDGYFADRSVVETSPGIFSHSPRNTYRQPWFKTLDLRLSKTFRLGSRFELELMGEVFNAFDDANWFTTTWVLSAGCFTDDEGQWVPCATFDDFGENNVPGDPRSFQLGMRFSF
jgi:hypothetical protein